MVVHGMAEPGKMETSRHDDESFETLRVEGPAYTLRIVAPKTVFCESGDYTTYGISLQTTSAAFRLKRTETRRRFSDFQWLRKELNKIDNWRSPPALTSRRFWNLFDPQFIESRREQLEKWTNEVLSEPAYLSHTAVHLFLQTEMSVEQVDDYLQGRVPEETVEEIWRNQGKLYDFQAHNILHNNLPYEPIVISFSPDEEQMSSTSPSPPVRGLLDSLDHAHSAQLSASDGTCTSDGERSLTPYGSASDLDSFQQRRMASPDSGFQDAGGESSESFSSPDTTTTTTTESCSSPPSVKSSAPSTVEMSSSPKTTTTTTSIKSSKARSGSRTERKKSVHFLPPSNSGSNFSINGD